MEKHYKIGVVGAGARGETFARQLYAGTRRASLFGICDIDADRLGRFCDYCELPNARQFTNTSEFLAHPELDAVIITTPEFTHADVACEAMTNGKAVYLEKPMAHTVEDCYRVIETQRRTKTPAYVGFNLRASAARQKLKEIVASGMLGQIVHIDGLEQLSQAHSASFMRRFHRKSANSGGLLNHKCSHDLDIMLWTIGHEHKVTRIASFGGCNVFTPQKQPAATCGECPTKIYEACPYKAGPGFVFPVRGPVPIYHQNQALYGGELCVYNDDKDLVDNQTVILEWDNGVRGNFNLQMFQNKGMRRLCVWGEKGFAEINESTNGGVRVTLSDGGDTVEYGFGPRSGGHGGTDPLMVRRFVEAIEQGGASDSGLEAGLVATLVATTADEARLSGKVITIPATAYR